MSYEEALTAVIQKEKSVIGAAAIGQGRQIGIEVDDDGRVESFDGEGKEKLSKLVDTYKTMTGPVAEKLAQKALSGFSEDLELPPELQ